MNHPVFLFAKMYEKYQPLHHDYSFVYNYNAVSLQF